MRQAKKRKGNSKITEEEIKILNGINGWKWDGR